ncbi:unnamed protein product [Microthlaspi erraticum]|uniref:DUF4283 domain-containing protein n=1 Tax=Microthlaspi erraticum TaxID=1685480 RepID=A0A6D2JA11_9BRAS|nr:unnamed protein product [Microthlaspi erraticum]
MSQLKAALRREGSATPTRMRLNMDNEIIQIPDCDYNAVAEQFKLTLIGRTFHREGRSIDALINMLPKPKIWDVEGRVQGINLGNGRFQFDFDHEEDMNKVLAKRPWHFNRWSFALEKWEPFTRDDFPNTMLFWVSVIGVPVHFWNVPTFTEIGKVLGLVTKIDAKRSKFQVSLNADKPLQFERKVSFPNGDIATVSLTYEGLQRYCFTCKLLSHEEGTCPQLTEEQREEKKKLRIEQINQGLVQDNSNPEYRMGNREAPTEIPETHLTNRALYDDRTRTSVPRREYQQRDSLPRSSEGRNASRSRDLRQELRDRRDSRGHEVWNRLERNHVEKRRNDRDRYHPYQRSKDGQGGSRDTRYEAQRVWRPLHERESRSQQKHQCLTHQCPNSRPRTESPELLVTRDQTHRGPCPRSRLTEKKTEQGQRVNSPLTHTIRKVRESVSSKVIYL